MASNSARTYSSPLREAQAKETRERILDAALRVLGGQGAAFTMPAVAEEANVSLPTVYRLFQNKEVLAQEAGQAVRNRFGIDDAVVESIDDMLDRQRRHIATAGSADERLLRAQYTLNADPLSVADIATREQLLKPMVAEATAGLSAADRKKFAQIVSIVFSSTTGMALWRFRLLNEEGADLIDWVIKTLIAGMEQNLGDK